VARTEEMRDLFIEAVGNLGESLGLNRTVCQMYALLYFSPEPLSPMEISEALRISKGNVSINIRKLIEWNAVKKVWRKGSMRSLFAANENAQDVILDKVKIGIEKRIKELRAHLRSIQEFSRNASDRKRQKALMVFYVNRTKQIEKMLTRIELFCSQMDTMKSFFSR